MGGMKVGVLISGRGSNMAALADACAAPGFPAEIAVVVSDVPGAGGLALAAARGIEAVAIDRKAFPDRAAFEDALDAALRGAGVEIVCLAGFMRVLGPGFLARWPDRVLNIHPSLLPAFRGLDTHARTIAAGVRIAGCTVHVVTPALDDGPILVQAAVPVLPDDTPLSLAERILHEEHRCYPVALRWMAEGRVSIDAGRAVIAGAAVPAGALRVPATE
jgi:phosphoribosylglycinamide formyltransferase-1